MITQDQWYKHPSFQTDLQALFNNPVLETALDICRDLSLRPVPITEKVNLVDFFAIMGAKKEGYNEFLLNLRALAQPEKPLSPAKKSWEYEDKPEGTPTNAKP